jgi:hypothetical protein
LAADFRIGSSKAFGCGFLNWQRHSLRLSISESVVKQFWLQIFESVAKQFEVADL